MTDDTQIVAELRNWSVTSWSTAGDVLVGEFYGDLKHRYEDGQYARTERLVAIVDDLGHTTEGVYKLVGDRTTADLGRLA